MSYAYGIFEKEADHIIALVHQHAPLEQILSIPCPECGSKISVSFSEGGTGFSLNCEGKPLHMTMYQEIGNPPPWWQKCYSEPTDITWYWREWHTFDDAGTLRMKVSGWLADDTRWSGEWTCPTDHSDYGFWKWVLKESGCTEELISSIDLEELRAAYRNAK